jgi:hypothetical protein
MKKCKKYYLLLMLVVALPMMMSCSKDSDNDTPQGAELVKEAVGTWMCTYSLDSAGGRSYEGLMVGKEVTINSDGTYTSTAQTFGYSGTYTINGNTITAKSSSGTFIVTVAISGIQMTWNGTASNGTTFKYVFKKES